MTNNFTETVDQEPNRLADILNQPLREYEDGSLIDIEIKGIRLVRTCFACPQQYDAFSGSTQVGYLRLRHGRFTVECPDVGGTLVYSANPLGDGIFAEHEEAYFLGKAVDAILAYISPTNS